MNYHVPVLLGESTEMLITKKTGTYFDATLGFGGHTSNFLSQLDQNSKIIATDKDENACSFCKQKFADDNRVAIYNTSFTDIRTISLVDNIDGYDGIFADLGVSSFQLDNADSGFSYKEDSVLDMRMNKAKGKPAHIFLNNASQEEIADVIYNFGEEKLSRRIAKAITDQRKLQEIKTSSELKSVIQKIIPVKNLNKTLSRVFQALRIFVNGELEELKDFLKKSVELLKTGGRIVILSYHSLEDRIVKDFFRYEALNCICPPESPICNCGKLSRLKIINKKPLVPGESEIMTNPRSRSVKLRAAERI
jgi:16S rRNA (cytosine1402-N4)-methyltransferase